ncbi:MAG TPA: hypothetical protein VL285_18560, partial [Bryobacteraceae bacterium]|nr:hypothetical protein [Bryobacteraceae bacterium]
MRTSRILPAAALAICSLAPLRAATALPCRPPENGWRVALPWLMYVNCGSFIDQLDTAGSLFVGRGRLRTPVAGVEVQVKAFGTRAAWLELRLAKDGSRFSLESGKDYEIDLAPDGQATVVKDGKKVPGPFDRMTVEFSTRPVARLEAPVFLKRGIEVEVRSNLAVRSFDPNEPVFTEIGLLKDATVLPSTSRSPGTVITECMVAASCPEPEPKQGSPATYGIVIVDLTEDVLRDATAQVSITGLRDLFGKPLKAEGKISLGGVPKTKDEANYYLKLSHQAGPGAKPGWVADIKFAPGGGVTRIHGFYLKPQVTIDAGQGTIDTAKTN